MWKTLLRFEATKGASFAAVVLLGVEGLEVAATVGAGGDAARAVLVAELGQVGPQAALYLRDRITSNKNPE